MAASSFSLHTSAEREYLDATRMIVDVNPRAALALNDALEAAFVALFRVQEPGRPVDDQHRQLVVGRSPYSVVYRVTRSGGVRVLAVAHASRERGYWRGRR